MTLRRNIAAARYRDISLHAEALQPSLGQLSEGPTYYYIGHHPCTGIGSNI